MERLSEPSTLGGDGMTLSALIRKRKPGVVATATLATLATQPGEEALKVARVATVAVANPTELETAPMTAGEERAIRAWLAHIEETDQTTIDEVLDRCRSDSDARRYFLKQADEARHLIRGQAEFYERVLGNTTKSCIAKKHD